MKEILHSFTRKDFRVDTFRSGGNGGQHQNKTDSGVRITHLETGLSAESREFKSQPQNKKAAFKRLAERMLTFYRNKYRQIRERPTETVRTYHAVDNRVTDHLTGQQLPYKLVMEKGIDRMIDARNEAMRAVE